MSLVLMLASLAFARLPRVTPQAAPSPPAKPPAQQAAAKPADQKPATPQPGVAAEPNPCMVGQTVTFCVPAGAAHVRAYGGGFGSGKTFDAGEAITDTLAKTTPYRFEVWPQDSGSAKSDAGPPPQTYRLVVNVYDDPKPNLATYTDWRHWKIDVLAGWNRYGAGLPDPANNALLYFEPQEDSVERLSVAIASLRVENSADLMKKVRDDLPTQYDTLKSVAQWNTTFCGQPATWMTFQGIDRAQPNTLTRSMVLAFVRGPRCYVISARTGDNQYEAKQHLLRSLVRSFALTPNRAAPKARADTSSKGKARPAAKEKGVTPRQKGG